MVVMVARERDAQYYPRGKDAAEATVSAHRPHDLKMVYRSRLLPLERSCIL